MVVFSLILKLLRSHLAFSLEVWEGVFFFILFLQLLYYVSPIFLALQVTFWFTGTPIFFP